MHTGLDNTEGGWTADSLARYVHRFVPTGELADRVAGVLSTLPGSVLADLVDDPAFQLGVDKVDPDEGHTVWLASPAGGASRSVVLKARLGRCPMSEASYVIAHELAHAYLRNEGWGNIDDPEDAADALAASWGFPRPNTRLPEARTSHA